MVSFSPTDGAHCDSVNSQSTVPSKTIQMDVKIPVQPSNFDALQKGALMGHIDQTKRINNFNINKLKYKFEVCLHPLPNLAHMRNLA